MVLDCNVNGVKSFCTCVAVVVVVDLHREIFKRVN